jgi:hypothetical protein
MSQLNARLEIVVGSRENHWIVCRRVELGRHHVLNKVKCVVHNAVNLMWRFCKYAARGARVFEWQRGLSCSITQARERIFVCEFHWIQHALVNALVCALGFHLFILERT